MMIFRYDYRNMLIRTVLDADALWLLSTDLTIIEDCEQYVLLLLFKLYQLLL